MTGDPEPGLRLGPTDIVDPFVRQEARKALVWLGIAALLALAVLLAEPLIVIFGGLVFAALIDGGARLLGRVLPIARAWRVAIILLVTALFIVWVCYFAGSQIADQATALPITLKTQSLRLLGWAEQHGVRVDPKFIDRLESQALGGVSQLTGVVGGLIGGVTTLFLIVVLGIYLAADPAPYQRGCAWLLPRPMRGHFEETLSVMGHSLRRLLLGRLIGMTIEGVSIGVALGIYGVPMAALLGLIAGLLAFLPNIGAPISGLLMVLVGLSGGPQMALYCVAVYIVVQTIDGNIIVPMVAKRAANLAPALVLGMQLVMGVLFGILGLALADPMLAMLKVLLERQAERGRAADQPDGAAVQFPG